jgi:hypothetical protein
VTSTATRAARSPFGGTLPGQRRMGGEVFVALSQPAGEAQFDFGEANVPLHEFWQGGYFGLLI